MVSSNKSFGAPCIADLAIQLVTADEHVIFPSDVVEQSLDVTFGVGLAECGHASISSGSCIISLDQLDFVPRTVK